MITRRNWLQLAAATTTTAVFSGMPTSAASDSPARIAITLDLEMSRNFPDWETTHWDYEKGNLNEETKRYSVEAARRIHAAGGVAHFFVVGRVLEQADVRWLKTIAEQGHPIGNHTYDHVNVLATRPEDLQFRFQRSPWLLRGQTVAAAIRENIQLTSHALQDRIGIAPNGFRTPGGFSDGLRQHPAVRALLKELGFSWTSSLYPPHPNTAPRQEPSAEVLTGIVAAQKLAQPFTYEDGMIEIPMSPISDIGAFRTGRWQLNWFLQAIEQSVRWAIEHRAVFDFLGHPSCLYVVDPQFQVIDLICRLVREAGDQARLVGLDTIAKSIIPPAER
ncbi:MAG: polysaccharide deacetylase family protein [Planctomycetota bacterium]